MNFDIEAPDAPEKSAPVTGNWRNIRWRPNESTGEVFNIGVMFYAAGCEPQVRMLDSFDRLRCLYDKGLAEDAKFLVEVTREALLAGADLPSSNILLSDPKFASGEDVPSILDSLFVATVPLGATQRAQSGVKRQLGPVSDSSVRQEVLMALREIAGLRADRIISPEKTMQVTADDGRVHYLDIPLQTPVALGTIASARFVEPKETELHLLRADSELQIARRVYRHDKLFMYVLRREEEERNTERTDRLLHELHWKFERVGVEMKSYTAPDLVARDIVEDMLS